jgi:hypothetical protein
MGQPKQTDREPTSATDGGCAKGMPRNVFTPSFDVPMNVPSSSVTMVGVEYVARAAKTEAVAAQRAKSFA